MEARLSGRNPCELPLHCRHHDLLLLEHVERHGRGDSNMDAFQLEPWSVDDELPESSLASLCPLDTCIGTERS